MKVLVIGGGGREHSLVWKIAQSPEVSKIFCAPGNPGISELAECIDITLNHPAHQPYCSISLEFYFFCTFC